MADPMRRSWLVQRLNKPRHSGLFKDNPFSFGGGLRNGGLSEQAMDLLRPIMGFDYMGAAEFEFGAVPKAFDSLAKSARKLVAFEITVPLSEVPRHWDTPKDAPEPTGDATLYVLCRKADATAVERRVNKWARDPYPRLKESLQLNTTLRPSREWHGETVGWLELDNGFLFFSDVDMWRSVCELFGVKAQERAARIGGAA